MAKLSDLLAKAASDINTITRKDLQSILRNCTDIALRLEAKTAEVSDVRHSTKAQLKEEWRQAVLHFDTEKSLNEWCNDVRDEQIVDLMTALRVATDSDYGPSTLKNWAVRMHEDGYRISRLDAGNE